MSSPSITLLTDFGLQDTYVAQMHGVIAELAPAARVIDLTHAIAPQQILPAAVALVDAVEAFPAGTIHVVVVDPGVGSDRRAIAAEIGPWRFVGPDNGFLTGVLDRWPLHRAVSLTNPRAFRATVSQTFHGRDIFAPVAARWATGWPIEELGAPLSTSPVRVNWPRPTLSSNRIAGEVLTVDRFGNLMTNITIDQLPATTPMHIVAGRHTIGPLSACYAHRPGEPLALVGSSGRLEIAVGNGSAQASLKLDPGDPVIVAW